MLRELPVVETDLDVLETRQLQFKDVVCRVAVLVQQLIGAYSTVLAVDLQGAPIAVVDQGRLGHLIVDLVRQL